MLYQGICFEWFFDRVSAIFLIDMMHREIGISKDGVIKLLTEVATRHDQTDLSNDDKEYHEFWSPVLPEGDRSIADVQRYMVSFLSSSCLLRIV